VVAFVDGRAGLQEASQTQLAAKLSPNYEKLDEKGPDLSVVRWKGAKQFAHLAGKGAQIFTPAAR